MNRKSVRIIDATLSEGFSAYSNIWTADQFIKIANCLGSVGVDMIECGRPAMSKYELDIVKSIVSKHNICPILVPAGPNYKDIEAAYKSGAQWVGITFGLNNFCSYNNDSIAIPKRIQSIISSEITYARKYNLHVRYTAEDGSYVNYQVLLDVFRAAVDAGAERLCFADSSGILEPCQIAKKISMLKKDFREIDIEVHLHDDRGLAIANSLSAIDMGANWISTSMNGVGERAGITDLMLLLDNLHYRRVRKLPSKDILHRMDNITAAYQHSSVDCQPVSDNIVITNNESINNLNSMPKQRKKWNQARLIGNNVTRPSKLSVRIDDLFINPKVISCTELLCHREGPGTRYVMIDERFVKGCQQYCIVRHIDKAVENPLQHVVPHSHTVDSLYLFLGTGDRLSGLEVEVQLSDTYKRLKSPASVFIPSGLSHSYRIIRGTGLFINHVLSENYNKSILNDNGSS